jgi:uncharacterized membrane protein YdjX (TVP38/TMEM64 family)
VPGPILAASSGLLFGPLLGVFVTLGATVGTACVASLVGRRAGRDSARAVLGAERADRLDALIQRHGLWAVVGQRFIPGLSDALASYAFGAFGVPLWQMAVGAFIGSVPRAFVYTALGASLGNKSPVLAYAAIGVWCITAVVGAFAAHRGFRHWRRHGGDEDDNANDRPQSRSTEKGDTTSAKAADSAGRVPRRGQRTRSAVNDLAALSDSELAQEIKDAIAASAPAWNDFVANNSAPVIVNDTQISKPLVMKYVPTNRAKDYRPASGLGAFDTPVEILRTGTKSPTPNYFIGDNFYTWGKAVYVVGISEPLSTAIYGRVGLVAQLDPEATWKVFDARDEANVKLYLEWLQRQPTYPTAATTFDTSHWLHGLRNDFRTTFNIDVVLCKPDEEDADKWYPVPTDTWLCVSDFDKDDTKPVTDDTKPDESAKLASGYSKRFCDVRLVVVGEEEFVIPINPNGPPRPPAPPEPRVAQLAISAQPPAAPQMLVIADAYWQGKIVRVQS